ncbi:ANTAR domain-containing protein [Streptomyces sp. NPDC091377]|uniref:ANTAR domain-containing protein n=1 Tax=Streptomyces sp. NPDC091377 TaxID=3365995 RepID=UPI0037F93D03
MIGDRDPDRVGELEDEVEHLRRAMDAHALVDQAIGVVVAVGHLHPEQGWMVLKRISQHTNLKLRDVARALVLWPAGGPLPESVRRALPHAMEQVRRLDREPARKAPGGERPGTGSRPAPSRHGDRAADEDGSAPRPPRTVASCSCQP